MKQALPLFVALTVCATAALAKLPAPSDEAKAKAAEAAAKAAYTTKVDNFKLCQSMDRVAATYAASARKAGKDLKPTTTPACEDPGPFVYNPPGAASAVAPASSAASASAAASAPAMAAAPTAKK